MEPNFSAYPLEGDNSMRPRFGRPCALEAIR